MTQHDLLRERYNQHIIKNKYSKIDDITLKEANEQLLDILNNAYSNHSFSRTSSLTFNQIETFINRRFEINFDYSRRKVLPDGGVIWMDNKYPILITEAKRQGTNEERLKEGKTQQAVGNAIERLGKNLIVFKNLFENEDILPFICFCWGCDFKNNTVLAKLYSLNSFYEINTLYTDTTNMRNKPFNILIKPNAAFSNEEMILPMLTVADYAIQYFERKNNL